MSVLVATGTPSVKIVDGHAHEVTPFAGADREGEFSSFGVGYVLSNGGIGSIWGLSMPQMLIQSWRGMKLLEHISKIGHGTLSACYYAANERVHSSEMHFLDELAEQFGARKEFEEVRQAVLASVPSVEEFERMLIVVRDLKLDVSVRELVELIEAGKLPHHPIVDELVLKDEERHREYDDHEAFIDAPMPPGESLGKLFGELRIDYMLDGPPYGGYGFDWGHIELARLDAYTKRYSTGKHGEGHQFSLLHTAGGIEGEIEAPYCVARDHTKYTFLTAAYLDGAIVVTTKVEKDGAEAEEGTYTVPNLRAMIGPVRKRRRLRRR